MDKLESYVKLSRAAAEITYDENEEEMWGELVTKSEDETTFIERSTQFPLQEPDMEESGSI